MGMDTRVGQGRGRGRERTPSRCPAECRARCGVHPVTPTSQPESKPKVSLLTDGSTRRPSYIALNSVVVGKEYIVIVEFAKGKINGFYFCFHLSGVSAAFFSCPFPVCVWASSGGILETKYEWERLLPSKCGYRCSARLGPLWDTRRPWSGAELWTWQSWDEKPVNRWLVWYRAP